MNAGTPDTAGLAVLRAVAEAEGSLSQPGATVYDIVNALHGAVSPSAREKRMTALREAGLVEISRSGGQVYWRLTAAGTDLIKTTQ